VKISLGTTNDSFEAVDTNGDVVAGMPLEDRIQAGIPGVIALALTSSWIVLLVLHAMQVGLAVIINESPACLLPLGLLLIRRISIIVACAILVIRLLHQLIALNELSIARYLFVFRLVIDVGQVAHLDWLQNNLVILSLIDDVVIGVVGLVQSYCLLCAGAIVVLANCAVHACLGGRSCRATLINNCN